MMAFHSLLIIFYLLNLAFAGSQRAAILPEEIHWRSVFPNTPFPKALKDLLPQKPAVLSAYNYGNPKQFINPFRLAENKGTNKEFKVSYYNYPVAIKETKGVNAPTGPFSIAENEGTKKEFNGVQGIRGRTCDENFNGNKKSPGDDHENNAALINETLYFIQEDLYSAKMVRLPILTKTRDSTTFLPYPIAESIPFSSDNLPEILNQFSVEAESREAHVMKETIKGCERDANLGEEMYCAKSFESFVDSSVSKLGNNIQLLANELGKETENSVFTIGMGTKNMGEKELVCHKMTYPYAVYLCHSIEKTVVYRVPLVGSDGTKANALAVCHKDTSTWSPEHPAFRILKVKPGTVPICHFVMRDTLIWVSN